MEILGKLRRDWPVTIFFSIMIIAVAFLAFPMLNYTRFYVAIADFHYEISRITINENNNVDVDNLEKVNISVVFKVVNPTDYSGFEVSSVECRLEYINGPREIVIREDYRTTRVITVYNWDLKIGSYNENLPLSPNTNETVSLLFEIDPNSGTSLEQDNARSFIFDFLKGKPTEIRWIATCRLFLASFMEDLPIMGYFSYVTPMTYA